MGIALDEPGGHSTMPPRKNGGNMDIKQLTAGTTLYLPVWVDGALFSVGDGHAAQGDGEVCVTAVEMRRTSRLRFGLRARGTCASRGSARAGPSARAPTAARSSRRPRTGPTSSPRPSRPIRYMIEHLVAERGLSREEAYILCSVAVDLKISEIVDAPNWIVLGVPAGERLRLTRAPARRHRCLRKSQTIPPIQGSSSSTGL